MKRFLFFYSFISHVILVFSTNYYVNATEGSDYHPGTSPSYPWKNLDNVNQTCFLPGDTIFLARGSIWHECLQPQGSGTDGKPIVITAFGIGDKPLLIGTGESEKGVITLFNQSFWEISSLEIVNNGMENTDRRGVEILAENAGIICHIYLKNLHIHHVKGLPGNSLAAKKTAGIYFGVIDDTNCFTRFDDVLIESCSIHDIANQGIAISHDKFQGNMYPGEGTWDMRKFTRFAIRDNVIYNITKNAMIIRMLEDGVVERNLCFQTALSGTGNTIFSRNVLRTLFQYNEGLLNRSHDHDGSLYDPDLNSPGTTWRYSYSHQNAHGLLWLCTTQKDGDISVYHNLSENDRGILNYFNYAYDQIDVYRNIYLSGKNQHSFLIRENPANYHRSTRFRENVIINRSNEMQFEYKPEEVPQEAHDRRIIYGNYFFGIPLHGDYETSVGNPPPSRYIHRGFHHIPDELDILYKQTPPVFIVRKEENSKTPIAIINGIPLFKTELNRKIRKLETLSYSLNRRKPNSDSIKHAAFNELLQEKVILGWMKQKGLKAAEVLSNLENYLRVENNFRKKNKEMGDSLFFGPRAFTYCDYYAYILACGMEELKDIMWGRELQTTDEEIYDFFLKGDLDRFDPKWASRGYMYSRHAVESLLKEKKFHDFMQQEFSNAVIVFQPPQAQKDPFVVDI